jgi:hypothetical protein
MFTGHSNRRGAQEKGKEQYRRYAAPTSAEELQKILNVFKDTSHLCGEINWGTRIRIPTTDWVATIPYQHCTKSSARLAGSCSEIYITGVAEEDSEGFLHHSVY